MFSKIGPNVRRYVEYSSPTIGGVGAAFAHPLARLWIWIYELFFKWH